MTGIFIIRGMTLTIPSGGLTINSDGAAKLALHVRFDVVPVWLEIARKHRDQALLCGKQVASAWPEPNEEGKARLLEAEFMASMQAIVAAATSFEALFSVLKPIVLPSETAERWAKRRPKRYIQISEVCRIAFQLPDKGAATLQRHLKEIFLFRDRAIHPSGVVAEPLLHPELNVGMDPRLVWFRATSAALVVQVVTEHLVELAFKGVPLNDEVQRYASSLQDRFNEMFPDGILSPENLRSEDVKS